MLTKYLSYILLSISRQTAWSMKKARNMKDDIATSNKQKQPRSSIIYKFDMEF